VVVDNASNDGSLELLTNRLPGVHILGAEANEGFSAGCNIGIRAARQLGAQRVLLLNSDATVETDTLETLEKALASHPRLGIAGPVLLSRSEPKRVQSMGIEYSTVTGRMRHRASSRNSEGSSTLGVLQADGVSGCAMLIRCDVFEAIGLFAEEYFFGFEDLDFCLRARNAGFHSACVGRAVVVHDGSLSVGRRSPLLIYFATRNHLLLARRVATWRWPPFRWLQSGFIVALNLAHVLVTSEVPRREGLRGLVRGVHDHMSGRYRAGSAPRLSRTAAFGTSAPRSSRTVA
jgi:GT2 family glycosyltransferase